MKRKTAHNQLLDHVPPCDVAAERAVLAVVLLEPRRIDDVAAALEPGDFTDEINRSIYEAMLQLNRRGLPPDVTLLVGELRDSGQYNAENGVSATTLVGLYQLLPLACHLDHYLERVRETSRRRHADIE